VKLSLDSPVEVEIAARKVQDRAREMGVDATRLLVQEQLAAGPEFLIGVTVDPIFGPAMTVRTGGGGVSGETEFNLLPLRKGEAESIASSASDGASIELTDSELKELINVVERFAWLAEDLSDRILEIEANPIIITGGRAVAVDALAVAKDEIGEN
jgi:hypothetical protein